MDTSVVEGFFPTIQFESSKMDDGESHLLGKNDKFQVEIIPNKSVSFFANEITPEILDALTHYMGNRKKAVNLLNIVDQHVKDKPNQTFRENIGGDLFLTGSRIAPSDSSILYLRICEG